MEIEFPVSNGYDTCLDYGQALANTSKKVCYMVKYKSGDYWFYSIKFEDELKTSYTLIKTIKPGYGEIDSDEL